MSQGGVGQAECGRTVSTGRIPGLWRGGLGGTAAPEVFQALPTLMCLLHLKVSIVGVGGIGGRQAASRAGTERAGA